jgi:hypothetical protein
MKMEMPAFRVWHQIKDAFDAKTKEWTYIWRMSSVQILNITAKEVTIESKYGYGNRLYRIGENCSMMQSIGVKDIHQKPVFTGDFVKVKDAQQNVHTGVVEERGALRLIRTPGMELSCWDDYEIEVTGNIYEQSEDEG